MVDIIAVYPYSTLGHLMMSGEHEQHMCIDAYMKKILYINTTMAYHKLPHELLARLLFGQVRVYINAEPRKMHFREIVELMCIGSFYRPIHKTSHLYGFLSPLGEQPCFGSAFMQI